MKYIKHPNILLIHADQHRWDCIGAYGNKDIKTPNLDILASEGVLYRNSFCPFPVCTPSRYSLLTGLYVHQHMGCSNRSTLPSGVETFPQILKEAGYHTKAVGKMHFTPTYLDVGFEDMILAEQDGLGRYDDDYHRYLKERDLVDSIDLMDQVLEYRKQAPQEYWDTLGTVKSNLSEEHHSTTWIGERALETLDKWDDNSNFMMVGFIKPHHPFDPPAPWSGMYNPDELTLLPGWIEKQITNDLKRHKGYFPYEKMNEDKLRKAMAAYYANISHIDHYVGRMIEVLKNKGIYDNTLIIYTSDHGDYMGYHNMILKGGYMYDPLMKVPLIIKYPHQKEKGVVSEALISNIDIAPTVLTQAECRVGEYMTGIDLSNDGKGRDFVFAEAGSGIEYMVRSRTRKLLWCKDERLSQFFDLENDPFELNNLINCPDYQNEITKYKEVLAKWILFDAPVPVHVNENAPIIRGSNIIHGNSDIRESSINYFREKMKSAGDVLYPRK